MDIKELRTKTKEELQTMFLELQEKLRDLRFKVIDCVFHRLVRRQ